MTRNDAIKVGIMHGDRTFRSKLEAVVQNVAGFHLVWSCASLAEAKPEWLGKVPGIVVVDLPAAREEARELVRELIGTFPAAKVLVVSDYEDSVTVFEALRAGVAGYIIQRAPLTKVCEAIQDAHAGGCPISPQIARRISDW